MNLRLIGGGLILASCAWTGFSAAVSFQRQEDTLLQLQHVLSYMICQLQFRQLPLPTLCRQASLECSGMVSRILFRFSEMLECQIEPDAAGCMQHILRTQRIPNKRLRKILLLLGRNLGSFDLQGQIKGLEEVMAVCEQEWKPLSWQKQNIVRSYRALGICAGAALTILFL